MNREGRKNVQKIVNREETIQHNSLVCPLATSVRFSRTLSSACLLCEFNYSSKSHFAWTRFLLPHVPLPFPLPFSPRLIPHLDTSYSLKLKISSLYLYLSPSLSPERSPLLLKLFRVHKLSHAILPRHHPIFCIRLNCPPYLPLRHPTPQLRLQRPQCYNWTGEIRGHLLKRRA